MKTSDVIKVVSPVIRQCLADAGLDVIFLKGYQPIQQGIPSDAAVFYHVIQTPTDSWQGSYSTYNDIDDNFITRNLTQSGFTLQLTCRSLSAPDDEDPIYAEDILVEIRNRMSAVEINRTLKRGGVGIYVPSGITTSVQQDEAGQWAQMPILELGLSFVSGYNTTTERVKSIEGTVSALRELDEYNQAVQSSIYYAISSDRYSNKFTS